jgi:hypothetical protein
MFAVNKIVENRLFALRCPTKEDEDSDVLMQIFENWQDTSYLYSVLRKYSNELKFYDLTPKEAAKQILHENNNFYKALIEAATAKSQEIRLDLLFEPLHKKENSPLLVQVKAYGAGSKPSLTRIYAIKLLDGSYVIIGGLIKVGKSLQDFSEGIELLKEIKKVQQFLERNGYLDAATIESTAKQPDHYL